MAPARWGRPPVVPTPPVGALLVRPERIELPTCWFEASRSIQLSYGRPLLIVDLGLPIFDLSKSPRLRLSVQSAIANRQSKIPHRGVNGGTRTLNPWSHSPVL